MMAAIVIARQSASQTFFAEANRAKPLAAVGSKLADSPLGFYSIEITLNGHRGEVRARRSYLR